MKNIVTAGAALAAPALSRVVATPELEVYARAVPSGAGWGEVCPATGDTSFQVTAPSGSDRSERSGLTPEISRSGIAGVSAVIGGGSVMNSVQLSKPRTGYCATGDTG